MPRQKYLSVAHFADKFIHLYIVYQNLFLDVRTAFTIDENSVFYVKKGSQDVVTLTCNLHRWHYQVHHIIIDINFLSSVGVI